MTLTLYNLQTSFTIMHILRFYALWKWSMSQIGPKGEKKCSGKGTRIVHLTLLWHLRLTMKLGSRSLHTLNSKAVFCVKYDPNRANKKVYMLWKNNLREPIWPWPLTYKLHSRSLHTHWPQALCEWSLSQIEQRGEKICPGQGFCI